MAGNSTSKKSLSCATCGEWARWYYLGARCPEHAPSEEQVRQHAIRNAKANDRVRPLTQLVQEATARGAGELPPVTFGFDQ